MKSTIQTLIFCLLILLTTAPCFSQPPGPVIRRWKGEGQCWKASELELSQEQRKSLDLIQQTYLREIQLFRLQLFTKRLELRELLTNPATKTETIRGKYSEIIDLRSKQEEKALEYLIKVRGLLTPEQLKNWCPDQEFPTFRQMIHGPGPTGPMRPEKTFPPME